MRKLFDINQDFAAAAVAHGYESPRGDATLPLLTEIVTDLMTGYVDAYTFGLRVENTGTENSAALREAETYCRTVGRGLYIRGGAGEYLVANGVLRIDGRWSGLGILVAPDARFTYATTIDEDVDIEAGWGVILDGSTHGALSDFLLTGLHLDGNRGGIVGFATDNTTLGIVAYPDGDFENVTVHSCRVKSMLQGSGFAAYAGGVKFVHCESWDHDYHGGFCSRDTTFGSADKVVEWIDFDAHDCGQKALDDGRPGDGCGLDVGRYCRTVVVNLSSRWNGQGMKFSIGTEYLKVRGARLDYNLGNGFQDTDTVGTAVLDLDGITARNNGGVGFRLVSGASVRMGHIFTADNYCRSSDVGGGNNVVRDGFGYSGGTLQGADIMLGTSNGLLRHFRADSLITHRSPAIGVLVDGVVRSYSIGYVESKEAQTRGFSDAIGAVTAWVTSTAYALRDVRMHNSVMYECLAAHTSGATTEPGIGASWTTNWVVFTPSGEVMSGLMIQNNNAGTAASAAAAAVACERTGSFVAYGIHFRDDQASVTQHTGFAFTDGVQAHVDGCHLGLGINPNDAVRSATAGTVVTFGDGNTGALSVRKTGTHTADGGGTGFTVTHATAMSQLGGAVYVPTIEALTADTAPAKYVSTVNDTTLTVTFTSATAGGSGNISFRYRVAVEIRR